MSKKESKKGSKETSPLSIEAFASYLATEMDGLHQRSLHYEQVSAGKINFYLVIVTAFAGGLVLMASNDTLISMTVPAACLVLIWLLAMGLSTLRQCLDISATVTTLYRRAGRIRQWFLDAKPEYAAYLPFTVGEDRPNYNPDYALMRGMESILLLVNAGLAGVLISMLYTFIVVYLIGPVTEPMSNPNILIAVLLGFGISILAWRWQKHFSDQFLAKWEKRQIDTGMIHFPSDPTYENS